MMSITDHVSVEQNTVVAELSPAREKSNKDDNISSCFDGKPKASFFFI